MTRAYAKEIDFLEELGSLAGAEILKYFRSNCNARYKADRSVVTDADLASEKLIIDRLQKEFPNDAILSEEAGISSHSRKAGGAIWIIDPLDGTTNFANDYPFFCVSIACAEFDATGRLCVMNGVVHDPIRQKTYAATRGGGTRLGGITLQVAKERLLEDCFLVTGFSYHRGDELRKDIELFLKVAQVCPSIRRDGAAALDMALVCEGVYDGYWESGLQPWDIAAGALLITEAGGAIRNFAKKTEDNFFDIESGDLVCGTVATVRDLCGLVNFGEP